MFFLSLVFSTVYIYIYIYIFFFLLFSHITGTAEKDLRKFIYLYMAAKYIIVYLIMYLSDFDVNCKLVIYSHANICYKKGFEEPNDGVRGELSCLPSCGAGESHSYPVSSLSQESVHAGLHAS